MSFYIHRTSKKMWKGQSPVTKNAHKTSWKPTLLLQETSALGCSHPLAVHDSITNLKY